MCAFEFKNSRFSQHFRRHHHVHDLDALKAMKEDMRKFSAELEKRYVTKSMVVW